MISFVVQNFFATPFLPKTQRYNNLIVCMNTKLLYMFIKNDVLTLNNISRTIQTLPFTSFLSWRFFSKTFYAFFKKIYTRSMGIMTINLTKSFLHKTFDNLDNFITSRGHLIKPNTHKYSIKSVTYLQPVTIVSFAFQKKTYDTLMIHIMLLLVGNYHPNQNSFNLYYGFIFSTATMSLYPSLNLFYFKLRRF